AKSDLATVMFDRWLASSSFVAIVTPQNWQEKLSYEAMRRTLLSSRSYVFFARIGNNAWQTQSGAQPFKVPTVLSILARSKPRRDLMTAFLDIDNGPVQDKARLLTVSEVRLIPQSSLLRNPESRILT